MEFEEDITVTIDIEYYQPYKDNGMIDPPDQEDIEFSVYVDCNGIRMPLSEYLRMTAIDEARRMLNRKNIDRAVYRLEDNYE